MGANKRSAFTLVELLVVIALMMVLASLSVMFVPHISEQQRAARGATLLQQWLIQAQTQALRDQAPRGLRIYVDVNGNLQGLEAQFIMQPDDFTGGTLKAIGGTSPATATITNVDISNGSTDKSLWSVQDNDYLEVFGGGLVRRIKTIDESPPGSGQYVLQFESGTVFDFDVDTSEYRIIRQPRVASDEALAMPEGIIIDFKTNADYGTAMVANRLSDGSVESYDVVFGPAGNIIGSQMGTPSVLLWVRDGALNLDEGEPTLITIYSRTGAIEAHPVNFTGFGPPGSGWDPYTFTRDGRSSGG